MPVSLIVTVVLMIRTANNKTRHLIKTFSSERTAAARRMEADGQEVMHGTQRGRRAHEQLDRQREIRLYPMRLLKAIQARKKEEGDKK